jgi:hypothetical protein
VYIFVAFDFHMNIKPFFFFKWEVHCFYFYIFNFLTFK